jgi:hypothetical protein
VQPILVTRRNGWEVYGIVRRLADDSVEALYLTTQGEQSAEFGTLLEALDFVGGQA